MIEEVDWQTGESHCFLNPRTPLDFSPNKLPTLSGHVWIKSSGTTSTSLKMVALSKQAMLISAQAVNEHVQATNKDICLNPLPVFHVGGLATHARGFLAQHSVIDFNSQKWQPKIFVEALCEHKATLSSLVPTQVFDLVMAQLTAPTQVRVVYVGGGTLSADLYARALELGWPLLPTYGMTECCSQVATAKWDSPEAHLLPHVEAKVDESGHLSLKSSALATGIWTKADGFIPIANESWWTTNDVVELEGRRLRFVGRKDQLVKVNGELVNLLEVDDLLQKTLRELAANGDGCVAALPDSRTENRVVVFLEQSLWPLKNQIMEVLGQKVQPFEKSKTVYFLPEILKTELGKPMRQKMVELVSQRSN